jgi:hypothetical protein
MADPVSHLRNFIRDWFTRKCAVVDDLPVASVQDTTRKVKRRRTRSVPHSERFVWAMLALIVALIGLVAIELVIILVKGAVNNAILVVVSSCRWLSELVFGGEVVEC